jgi:hypothetical protein
MKGKLIKIADKDYYNLEDENGVVLGTSYQFNSSMGDVLKHKLSKQNCDEIFGVVDVEKLAEEYADFSNDYIPMSFGDKFNETSKRDFIKGFNKAMELNKDKVFTEEQVIEFTMSMISQYVQGNTNIWNRELLSESLQQPTEIEVEIVMEKVVGETKIVGSVKEVKGSGDKITTYKTIPKLDVDGCLTLKRI